VEQAAGLVIAGSPGVEVLRVKQLHGRPGRSVRRPGHRHHGRPASIGATADRSCTWRRSTAGPCGWPPRRPEGIRRFCHRNRRMR
jgi:hypothetical protein